MMNIGIVGYSGTPFDEALAEVKLRMAFDIIKRNTNPNTTVNIVSGLTNIGIPKIAYRLAREYNFMTTGIACSKASEYECFPVDTTIIVGNNWGDESERFLTEIDVLIRVGGGKQSLAEVEMAKKMYIDVLEYDL